MHHILNITLVYIFFPIYFLFFSAYKLAFKLGRSSKSIGDAITILYFTLVMNTIPVFYLLKNTFDFDFISFLIKEFNTFWSLGIFYVLLLIIVAITLFQPWVKNFEKKLIDLIEDWSAGTKAFIFIFSGIYFIISIILFFYFLPEPASSR